MRALLALLLLLVPASSPGLTLEGSWDLVEQTYGEGSNNLADLDRPVRLELTREGARVRGKIWSGGDRSRRMDWPAFANDAGPLPVEVLELEANIMEGRIRARYRVTPSPTDKLVLEVVEQYELSEDGRALVGSMMVTFTSDGAERGSFVLHRRFVRTP